jgi:hypothetical protein
VGIGRNNAQSKGAAEIKTTPLLDGDGKGQEIADDSKTHAWK